MTVVSPDANARIEFGNQGDVSDPDINTKATLVLASYNIRYAVGRFLIASGLGRKLGLNFPVNRARAVQENIETAATAFSAGTLLPHPDILGLQEADQRTRRAGGQDVAAQLAERMSVFCIHAAVGIPRGVPPKKREWWLNFEEQIALHDEGDTGVAWLTRVPLQDVTRIDLPINDCPWRPRLALAATVPWHDHSLRLINVHIDPHGPVGNQHRQIEKVLAHVEEHVGPAVILGDFNSLSNEKAVQIRSLMESHGYTTPFWTNTQTWRGAGLRYHADWIFGRGVEFSRCGVAKPLNVSDHWPIWAEIALPIANC